MSAMRRRQAAGMLGAALIGLTGCAPQQDDLHAWMQEQRARASMTVEPLKPPTVFQPETFQGIQGVSPFSDEKLVRALRSDSATAVASRLLQAEQQRSREPLEEFPLDAFTMVGTLERAGRRVALVRVNGVLHQVRVGQYLGQNFGRITAISESQITLREIVQDASGEWIERNATLQLVEGNNQ
ncbi:Pilus assembly protein, PilP [Tepidimonas alkaliphilus]|uniref:Pilus assembly protein, PilP n=1 Tax=Tepidimonas alkaliphilus TaxID=2588942 RepID=A0A554W9H3_9BURK|nr:pilus assembly protein PilP [Tepidimonas alkaliphilus]TSE20220.1 Pilus assembly protein, PilP [Tepidimonas alkaliphilus]